MRKLLPSVLWLWTAFVFYPPELLASNLQHASNSAFSPTDSSDKKLNRHGQHSLQQALFRLESHYLVSFNYDDDAIKDISLSEAFVFNGKEKVEKVLQRLLRSLDLTYRKVDEQTFLILPKKRKQEADKKTESLDTSHISGTRDDSAVAMSQSGSNAQYFVPDRIIRGSVKDEQSQPLPGVNVVVKGTTRGTTTDSDGKYSLHVDDGAEILVFSFIGYLTQEVPIGNRDAIDVQLTPDVRELSEVVVVGFGEQKKATVTGAISSVGTKELVQSPQANISNALVGRMPGLLAVQRSGEPGNDQSILRIRGVGTFSGNQDPLVMVDGIETPNYNNIDPNEIESISILKDASATAVYGVRGANGVLLITTKRGKVGLPQVSFSSNVAVSTFTDLRKTMNSYDYARSYNEARKYDSYLTGGYTPRFTDEAIAKYQSHEDPLFYPDMDWVELMLKPSATQLQNNLNVRGGTEKIKYFISLGYFNQEGLFNTTRFATEYDAQVKYKRYNFRSNFDVTISKRFTANIDISSQIENQNRPNWGTGLFMEQLLSANPVGSPGIIDGKIVYTTPTGAFNPLLALNNGYQRIYNNFLNGAVRLNYDLGFITKGLSTHGTISYKNFNSQQKRYTKYGVSYEARRLEDESIVYIPNRAERPFDFGESIGKNRTTYAEFGLNYSRSFGSHTATGLLLYNQSKRFDPTLPFLVPNGYQGLVGRITYDYKSRYMAEVNLGYNGTENFAPGKRFGFFPAYSVGWIPSEEAFFPKNDVLSFLKVRGSYGEVGNDKIGGERFLYRPTSYVYSGSYYWGEVGSSYNSYPASQEGKIGNPDLTWERAKKTDVGLELGLWRDKIRITVDWFNESRNNILANKGTVPNIVGANLPAYNLGEMRNSGFDGEITYNHTAGSFNYWFKGNFTYAHNEVVFQDEVTRPFSYQYRTGQRFGQQFGLIARGFYNTWEEVNESSRPVYMWNNNKVQPGDIKYKDVNGDGLINQDDQVPIGYSDFPEKILGVSFGGDFKGFDFSILFQGATNVSVFASRRSMRGFYEDTGASLDLLNNTWTQERYEQGLPIKYPRLSVISDMNYQRSTFWQEDASYIRLKNAEIGYTFSSNFQKKAGIKSARIYINGTNLITWDKMFPGEDPEFPPVGANTEPYPLTRIVNAGLNINF